MAGGVRGSRTLTGSWGEVWVDSEKIFVLQGIEQKVEVSREDAQMGMDVDSKVTGLKGSGTLSIKKVYSRAKAVLEKLNAGQDVRCQIIAKLEDPDAVDGQIERWSTDNAWWNIIPVISWETGGQIQEEWEFGFTSNDMKDSDKIK